MTLILSPNFDGFVLHVDDEASDVYEIRRNRISICSGWC